MAKKIFNRDTFGATIAVFCVIGAFYVALPSFDFLNPLQKALTDFQLTDLVFSRLRGDAEVLPDTSIVLVNIGDCSREEIARQIEALNRFEPRIIAIDAMFRKPKSAVQDSALTQALRTAGNVILVNKLNAFNEQSKQFDTIETSHPMFSACASAGFSNLIIDQQQAFMTARTFSPKEKHKDSAVLAFPAKIAEKVNPNAVKSLLERDNDTETINFRGNIEKFYTLDVADVLRSDADLSVVRGKIVVMGFIGASLPAPKRLEDIFFTPMNERYAGKTFPDMYGVVVHANILSMILRGDYIDEMPKWLGALIAVLLCYANIVLFDFIGERHERWFDSTTVLLQFAESVLLLFLTVELFSLFRYKADFTLAVTAIALSGGVLEIYDSIINGIVFSGKSHTQHSSKKPLWNFRRR